MNKQELKVYQHKYYLKNKWIWQTPESKAKQKKWYYDNWEKARANEREWVEQNHKYKMKYKKQWRKDNPELHQKHLKTQYENRKRKLGLIE